MPIGAMYPGTFDPITNGHHELVRRGARIFDRIVVAVAASPHKTTMFSLQERTRMAREVLADIPNVTVDSYEGLTVEFARAHDLKAVVRGLRAVSDFEYEFQLSSMNRTLRPDVETVFLCPEAEYNFISSTLVREVAALGGDVSRFVHPAVQATLKQQFGQ
jgi:pantetheine-phosphate adenylyltransferase